MSPRNNAVCKCFASFNCGNAFCSIIPHATGRTAYYTAPIKALVSEKFFDMVDILGRENLGMITGDSTISTEAPVICCTAEILANQALREGPASKVGCVVMDESWGHGERAWEAALDDYFAEHNEIRLDGDARSAAYLSIDESPEVEQHLWHVRQIFLDENADGDFRIEADVNPDATQGEGEVIFKNYRVGFVEDLAE